MARVVSLKKAKSAAVPADGREELVEIAVDLFAARGFAGTSIRDIADVAGRSVSNIYHYFENKEALWFAIFERSIKALPGQLREAIEGVEGPRERFIALVRGHLDVTEHYRREAKMFFIDEERLSPAGNRINKRVQRDILSIYVAEIEGLRRAGLLAPGDTQIAALNTLGAINWYLRWSRAGMSGPKRAEVVDQVLQFILRGVGCA
ncbi:MAG: TetR/AcrR family transcriptional regulator [Sphingobium sp.]|jgi:AcrR family transcriptional regulator|nr:TetR/AcrR family transcriptional regulator [Sphingobium sp.]MCI1271687.1 TetR/AcrR family transcriptional regulator [Sphingobium sp.]MCI1757033.1 TetR/AcrR family transcriptional regulator [Sphingobium sp.]MCI2054134.1 TetR/AcrR family transcriptional regulator [Sphingobium sp.]